MTDVRLTATNPEDSSVVPVACNSRGELLVTETVIEQIDNSVTFTDGAEFVLGSAESVGDSWKFDKSNNNLSFTDGAEVLQRHLFDGNGRSIHRRLIDDVTHSTTLCSNTRAYQAYADGPGVIWSVNWSGVSSGSGFRIFLDTDNPANYSSVRNTETGEETKEYIGPVIDVREELEFLRAQVQALMEKLKMSPEGGWPVWDGSSESQ